MPMSLKVNDGFVGRVPVYMMLNFKYSPNFRASSGEMISQAPTTLANVRKVTYPVVRYVWNPSGGGIIENTSIGDHYINVRVLMLQGSFNTGIAPVIFPLGEHKLLSLNTKGTDFFLQNDRFQRGALNKG